MKNQVNFTQAQLIRYTYCRMLKNEIPVTEWWSFLETVPASMRVSVFGKVIAAQNRLQDYKNSFRFKTKIRPYCNRHDYTDVHPFEVVKVISPRCVELRALVAEQTVFPKDVRVGGFSAITVDNYNQDYKYTPDNDAPTFRIFLGKKGWGNGRFHMCEVPYKFYDYNF